MNNMKNDDLNDTKNIKAKPLPWLARLLLPIESRDRSGTILISFAIIFLGLLFLSIVGGVTAYQIIEMVEYGR